MANQDRPTLTQTISDAITTNGNQEITGAVLLAVLQDIIDSLFSLQTDSSDAISEGTTNLFLTTSERNKLSSLVLGALLPAGGDENSVLMKSAAGDYLTAWTAAILLSQTGLADRAKPIYDAASGQLLPDLPLVVTATSGNVGVLDFSKQSRSLFGYPLPHTVSSITIDPTKALLEGKGRVRYQMAAKPTYSGAVTIVEVGDFSAWSDSLVNIVDYEVIDPDGDPTIYAVYRGTEAAPVAVPSFMMLDIGTASGGSASSTQLVSNGADMGNNEAADSFTAWARTIQGDFEITVQIDSESITAGATNEDYRKIFLFFRESIDADSVHTSQTWRSLNGRVNVLERLATGGNNTESGGTNVGVLPRVMRLSRVSGVFTHQIGTSIANLAVVESGSLSFAGDGLIGIGATSTALAQYITVNFTGLTVS